MALLRIGLLAFVPVFSTVVTACFTAITALAAITVTGAAFAATLLVRGGQDGVAVFVHTDGVIV